MSLVYVQWLKTDSKSNPKKKVKSYLHGLYKILKNKFEKCGQCAISVCRKKKLS